MIDPRLVNIHPKAKIHESAVIEPFATVEEDVEIGEGSWVGSNAVILNGARIGKYCRIFHGAVIAGVPQDLKFNGEVTTAEIGDNTTVREFVTISRGTADRDRTVIGENCLLMAYVHIAHDCIIGNNCILSNLVQLAGHIVVDAHVVIGGTAAIHQFVRVGSHSMIAGGALINKDIPPFTLTGRDYPVSYKGINAVGLRRRGFSEEKINELQKIYTFIYKRGLNNSTAIEMITTNVEPSTERESIIEFIRSSERGIMRGPNNGSNPE